MTKKIQSCVKKIMENEAFKPFKGKTKEESAWAVCNAKTKDCMVCEIDDDELFMEAVNNIVKELSKEKEINTEDYILEGISVNSFEETISKEDLEKINKFTVKPVTEKQISIFTALLIDDKITRNHTQYNKDFQNMLLSLPHGEGNFVGAPILFGDKEDHQHAASAQVGRIFDAWQVLDESKNYGVMAKIYVINEKNDELIKKVNTGILKELSISTKVEIPLCSICSQDYKQCDHQKGVGGCYVIMSGRGFVAEASFVAVPGSNAAKILNADELKGFLKIENLKELFTPIINEAMDKGLSKESLDVINSEMAFVKTSIESILKRFDDEDELAASGNLAASGVNQQSDDTTTYPIDVVSFITEITDSMNAGKDFVIRNLSKYNLPAAEFRGDVIPKIQQGLKGEDIQVIVKFLFDNIEIMGINMSKIETHLKVNPVSTNMTYTGDMNNIPMLLRFLTKKMDSIDTRINKLKGRFDLEDTRKTELINETVKMGVLCNRFKFEEKELAKKFFDNFSTEEIIKLKDEWFVEGSAIFTPKKLGITTKEKEKDKEVKPKLSPKEIAKKINGGNKNG